MVITVQSIKRIIYQRNIIMKFDVTKHEIGAVFGKKITREDILSYRDTLGDYFYDLTLFDGFTAYLVDFSTDSELEECRTIDGETIGTVVDLCDRAQGDFIVVSSRARFSVPVADGSVSFYKCSDSVVQVMRDIVIDMIFRCSAGQSLVIEDMVDLAKSTVEASKGISHEDVAHDTLRHSSRYLKMFLSPLTSSWCSSGDTDWSVSLDSVCEYKDFDVNVAYLMNRLQVRCFEDFVFSYSYAACYNIHSACVDIVKFMIKQDVTYSEALVSCESAELEDVVTDLSDKEFQEMYSEATGGGSLVDDYEYYVSAVTCLLNKSQ